ncbi:hypothetical protein [Nitrososphaera sp.]|uniref:hypothetical protein n=1 Tax=Nitrososphaera sp. TaxID=1971748 RepID=UPI00307D6B4D
MFHIPQQYYEIVNLERLKKNNKDPKGKAGFAFDTKLESFVAGSAAKFIEKKLKEMGLEIIRPRGSAIVIGKQKKEESKPDDAALKEGMEELFESVGKELGRLLLQSREQRAGIA